MDYSGIALFSFQMEPMKYKLTTCILLLSILRIPCKSSVLELRKHNDIFKAKTPDCTKSSNSNIDSTTNISISIQGKQNLVTVKTDSLAVQTDKSIINPSNDSNSVEINGEGNSVSVTQETKGKIAVKQSGNNNSVKITQSSHQP